MIDSVFSWKFVAGTILALSPITSYGDTVWSIYNSKQCAGFSLDLTAIMLISSILRVFFYFGEPYEMSLLIQSLLMIVIQLVLLRLALKYRVLPVSHKSNKPGNPNVPRSRARSSSASIGVFSFNTSKGSILDKDPDEVNFSRRKSVSEVVHNLRPSSSVHRLRAPGETQNLSFAEAGNFSNSFLNTHQSDSEDSFKFWRPNQFYKSHSNSNLWTSASSFFEYQIMYPLQDFYYYIRDSTFDKTIYSSYSNTRFLGFWMWIDPSAYWLFLAQFFFLMCLLHVMLGTWLSLYIQAIGFIGLMLEAILPLPQLITNSQQHSVQGFRLSLLANWLAGDVSKLFYYMYGTSDPKKLAPQFIMCVVIQTILDLIGGWQYVYYKYFHKSSSLSSSAPWSQSPSSFIPSNPDNNTYSQTNTIPSSQSRDSIELDVVPFPDYAPRPLSSSFLNPPHQKVLPNVNTSANEELENSKYLSLIIS